MDDIVKRALLLLITEKRTEVGTLLEKANEVLDDPGSDPDTSDPELAQIMKVMAEAKVRLGEADGVLEGAAAVLQKELES